MTANQLQAQKNAIDQQIADEQARHNKSVEEETALNDAENIRIKDEANAIQQQIADETERHNKVMEDINDRYNTAYVEMQRAQGERKLELQAELQQIERDKAEEVARHNAAQEDLSTRSQQLLDDQNKENERHNLALEGLKVTDQSLEERRLNISEELNKMQNAYWTGILASQQQERLLQQRKQNDTYDIALRNIQVLSGNLELTAQKWEEAERARVKSETIKNYFNTFSLDFKDVASGASLLKLIVP